MNNITPDMVWVALLVFLALCGAVNTVASAVEKIVKAVKAAKAPNNEQNERLAALEEWRKDVDGKLNNDKQALEEIHEGTRVTQRALLALLAHGIDGNNVERMEKAKEELENLLINH